MDEPDCKKIVFFEKKDMTKEYGIDSGFFENSGILER